MIRELLTLLYLSAAGFTDYKKRTIPVYLPVIGLGLSCFLYFYLKDIQLREILVSAIPGFVLVLISLASSGKVGIGDGLIIIPFGLMLGFWDSTTSIILAMIFSGLVAMFLLITKKKSGSYELPFLPFLLCGLVLTLLIK